MLVTSPNLHVEALIPKVVVFGGWPVGSNYV